jgi:two-component system nitrogen regulation response regulator GlnG
VSRQPLKLLPLPTGVRLARADSPIQTLVDGRELAGQRDLTLGELDEGVVLELSGRVALLLHRRPPPLPGPPDGFGLIGASAGIEAVRQAIARVAPLSIPVLIRGETGTGKELVARALHEHSPRARGPFLGVSLGALTPTLAAAELFGARRGSFTGSVAEQVGFFVRADGGTLFLDEIGEAPPEVQAMLLRALEAGEIVPVGAQASRGVDVRIVAATDLDLEAAVRTGAFRSPLLHRLAGYSIRVPPLRRRREDLGRLLLGLLRRELERFGEALPEPDPRGAPWLPASLVARLARYSWPGNVRQLQNVARHLAVDGRGQPVLPELDLAELLPEPVPLPAPAGPAVVEPPEIPPAPWLPARRPSEVAEDELLAALQAHRWNLKAAAAALGIARTSLYVLMERSTRVRPASEVPAAEIAEAHGRHGGDLAAMVADLQVSERALRQRLKDLGLRPAARAEGRDA